MILRLGASRFWGAISVLFVAILSAFWVENSYAADSANGGKLYAKHCVTCHGADGVNVMPDAPNFSQSERLLRPDVFILAAIREGKNAMPSFQGLLKDQEILDVISYLRVLEQGGPIRP